MHGQCIALLEGIQQDFWTTWSQFGADIIHDANVYMCVFRSTPPTHKSEKQATSHGLLSLDLADTAHFALLNLPLVSP